MLRPFLDTVYRRSDNTLEKCYICVVMMSRYRKTENLVYLFFWLLIIAFTVVSGWSMAQEHTALMARRILVKVLVYLLPLFILFAIHNFLLAPLFVYKDRKVIYATSTAALLLAFVAVQIVIDRKDIHRPKVSMDPIEYGRPPVGRGGGRLIVPGDRPVEHAGPRIGDNMYRNRMPRGDMFRRGGYRPPFFPMSPGMALSLIAFLTICANLGVKYVCWSAEEREKLKTLENENLGQQLQYLRYQINPHFFMNTLNNIHALVDIDPGKAKTSILELSRLMRYILYEGSKPTIPLSKEKEFLSQYVALMKMRYADDIKVDLDLSDASAEGEVPPLVFVTFVENAFKHGISYEGQSFVSVSMSVAGQRLRFSCVNSRHAAANVDKCSGIGLENVRKRLTLLYGDDYVMKVSEKDDVYDLHVEIPLLKDTP